MSVAVDYPELDTFKGCPFSNKAKDEITSLTTQISKAHPIRNIPELPSCDEGVTLVKSLNEALNHTQLEQEQQKLANVSSDVLENPELASAMREGTKIVHRAAETSVFTKRFLKGDINADEYGRYINSLYFVYLYMESLLEEYKDHPVVKLIHFPIELNRTKSLEKDLLTFYGPERLSELTDPKSMTPAVKHYVDSMRSACDKSPALLIAHSYSRYLGDLSGGQILSKRLKKSVLKYDDTTWDSQEGLSFYIFSELGNQAEFKNFYRERLDCARVNAETKDMIVAESIKSFELNIAVFDEIQSLSEAGKLVPSSVGASKQKNQESTVKKSKYTEANSLYWGAMAVAAGVTGILLYQRFFQKN